MAIEDFTTYTESDPGSDITITASKVSWTNLETRNSESYVYDDKGAGHFSGDFEHKCNYKITSSVIISFHAPWMMGNDVDDIKGVLDASGSFFYIVRYNSSGTMQLLLREVDAGTQYDATLYNTTENTDYYLTIDRDETVGTYGQLRLRVYTDAARTTLVNTQTVSLHSSKKDFRYIFPLNTYNTANSGAFSSGFTENLDLQESTFQAAWAMGSTLTQGIAGVAHA